MLNEELEMLRNKSAGFSNERITMKSLEVMNRNEFFAQRYGSRNNVEKISIIFYGSDALAMRSFGVDYDEPSQVSHYVPMLIPTLKIHKVIGINFGEMLSEDKSFEAQFKIVCSS